MLEEFVTCVTPYLSREQLPGTCTHQVLNDSHTFDWNTSMHNQTSKMSMRNTTLLEER